MKTAIALTLALATASSHAYDLSEDKTILAQLSVDQTAIFTLNCDGKMSLQRRAPAARREIIIRVDGNTIWSLKPSTMVYYDNRGAAVSHLVEINSDLLWELIQGVDLIVHWGDTDTDRFSLIGFSESLKQMNCIPVADTKPETRL